MTQDQFLGKTSGQKQKNPGQFTEAFQKHRDSMMMIRQGLKPPGLPAWALTSTPKVEAKHGR